MISEIKPVDFHPKFSAVGIYLVHEGRFLLMQFAIKYDRKWSGPSGKINPGESPLNAAIRETSEEAGILIDTKDITPLFTAYVRYPDYDFEWFTFRIELDKKPRIQLSTEHSTYQWVTPQQALTFDLMEDEDWCIRKAFNIK